MKTLRLFGCLVVAGVCTLGGCGDDDDGGSADGDSGTPMADGGADAGPSSLCPSGPCDLLEQDCPAGEGCYLSDSESICALAGSAGDGDPCVEANDCSPGLTCNAGACQAYCCGASDEGCPSGQVCAIQLVDTANQPTGAGLCEAADACDPLTQTGCEAGEGCFVVRAGGTVICATSTMDLPAGGDCDGMADACAAGTACVMDVCRAFCDTTAGAGACPPDSVCTSLGVASQPSWGTCIPAS